ncbi:hypothetical protein J4E90_010213 [Alternaria incomplexa]|uniref:uncharacterized protein n=1 Tax=Alternaria incomplexa TaxID=1187928 RepID=UPI00221F2AC0|nr:uncharacterized protein J4E90_010213 [Alternaria incomplexa]KAI4906754.1 hypothetical protein J4E90_010213 [Alternaria incomplexa]
MTRFKEPDMGEVHVGGGQCNVPEHEIKQNAGVSAQMALQAGQKAWELRQAAHGAGDAKAREEILAKAINKEIEAESFGKAAKYTQSGAFQGLAAGAGLGVQPGVTIGKLTGALVGGTVSTVTGLLGGGIGSVYGAMNGPMWDLGQMASQGVQGVVGDFLPDVKSTPSQKKALEKMVMQTKDTQAPSKEELEQMKNDAPDMMPQTWSQSAKDMTAWRPSMPSAVKTAGAGIAGVGAAMNPWGGGGQQQQQQGTSQPKQQPQKQAQQAPSQSKQQSQPQAKKAPQSKPSQPKTNGTQPPKQEKPQSTEPAKPRSQRPPTTRGPANPQSSTQSTPPSQQKQTPNTQQTPAKSSSQKSASTANKSANGSAQPKRVSFSDNKENNAPAAAEKPKRKPRKLGQQGGAGAGSGGGGGGNGGAAKKAPRKLESRKSTAAA